MAVTSIWNIRGRVDKVISYAVNPEKTVESDLQFCADFHAIDQVLEYTANEMKTERKMYVSGINCNPVHAAKQFTKVKKRWHNKGGNVAYHGYQAFKPGEVDAESAHQIGVKLAQELWGDRFEVVIATHLNTGHYHNHFVINSVSYVDGKKYNDCKESYQRMREVSDRLCREHHLSVIQYPHGRGQNYSEWAAEQNGKPTYRSIIRSDIDRAIEASLTEQDFIRLITEMDYTLHTRTSTGKPLKYPSIHPPDAKGNFRFHKLGKGYSLDEIKERIYQNLRRKIPFPEAERRHRGTYRYNGSFQKHRKITGLQALYFRYCYMLRIIRKRPTSVKRVSFLLREDLIKLDKLIDQANFLGRTGIETAAQLNDRKQAAEQQMEGLIQQRKSLRKDLKRVTRQEDVETIADIKQQITELSAKLKDLRKEVQLCKEIAERSTQIAGNIQDVTQQQNQERKEKHHHEYSRRRSGTGYPDVPGWR